MSLCLLDLFKITCVSSSCVRSARLSIALFLRAASSMDKVLCLCLCFHGFDHISTYFINFTHDSFLLIFSSNYYTKLLKNIQSNIRMNNSIFSQHTNHMLENMEKTEKNRRKINAMKATGIVRRIDDLGRVVVPKEIRRTLRIRKATHWRYSRTRKERLF